MIFKSSYRLRHIPKYNKGTHLVFVSKPLINYILMIIIGGWWVHGGHCTFIYIWTFVCLHMSEHKKKWKNFEFIQKYRTMWLIPLWFVYNPHMLQAKLLNVALKYYNKEKNANGWILKNSTSASSYNFQIQVKRQTF